MPDIKAIVAKQNPELLSLEDKARYKVLPDILEVIEIISLIANNKDKEDKKLVTRIIRDAVISGELLTETSGCAQSAKNANSWGGMYRLPIDYATVHKITFKNYIDANNWNLTDCLLNNWFDDIKTSKYKTRDDDFKAWINEKNPNIETMTKANIQNELIKRNSQLWTSGFSHWWKQQNIYKGQSGRKKINRVIF